MTANVGPRLGLAVLLLVACSDDDNGPADLGLDSAHADGTQATDAAGDGTGATLDGSVIPDQDPACPASPPNGYCDASSAPLCRYGTDLCRCELICSGMRPPPGQTHRWVCEPPPPAGCPASPPTDGQSCSPSGLVCVYGVCDETTARCVQGKWQLTTSPPPP